jgi:hypothetical protein
MEGRSSQNPVGFFLLAELAEPSRERFGKCRDIAEMRTQRLPTVFSVIA